MIFKHLKTSIRSLIKAKSYSLLNIVGLSTSLIVFLLITLYVSKEFSYDKYHEKADRIYRVYKEDIGNFYQGSNFFAVVPSPLAPTMAKDFPEVEAATRVRRAPNTLVKVGDQVYLEDNTYSADPSIFNVFSLSIIAGNASDPLSAYESVVLSRTLAEKYFGSVDKALGETIMYRDERPVQVSAVFEDMPLNSHFRLTLVVNFEGQMNHDDESLTNWNNSSYYAFVLLVPGADGDELQTKMPELRTKYADDPVDEDGQESIYYLQPLSDVHFTSGVNFDIAPNADRQSLYIYLGIAIMILVIAGVNYVNLATGRAMNKTKEIGIRKVIGAQKNSLMFQFLLESGLLVFTSLVLAVVSLVFILPAFSNFIGKDIAYAIDFVPVLLQLMTLGVVMTLVSGIYPAILLAGFKPVTALKGKGKSAHGNAMFRNILVVFQFTISCALILGAIVISRQLNYIQSMEVGFDKEQIVVVNVRDRSIRDQLSVFKDELRKVPGVKAVASSNSLPNNMSSSTNANWPGRKDDEIVRIYTNTADYDFVDLYGLEIVEGRNFDPSIDSDKKAVLLNESAVKALGWESPIGKQMLRWWGDTGRVVGVLKDYHQHSLHLAIEPSQIFFREDQSRVSIKLEGNSFNETIKALEAAYAEFNPAYPFDYAFFDEIFDRAYQTESKTADLINWFTILDIIIACLGLYGLAAHKVQHRIKEVGVRKVLGASVSKILMLLSRDFALLLIIAFAIAAPVAYFFMNNWLNDFAYHISIDLLTFALALVLMLLVAGITVGYRTYLAAARNPVESLREE